MIDLIMKMCNGYSPWIVLVCRFLLPLVWRLASNYSLLICWSDTVWGSDQLKSLCSNYYIRLLLFCGNIRFNFSFRLTYALHIRLSQIHTKNFLPTFSISFYSLVGVAADYISFKDEWIMYFSLGTPEEIAKLKRCIYL